MLSGSSNIKQYEALRQLQVGEKENLRPLLYFLCVIVKLLAKQFECGTICFLKLHEVNLQKRD